MIGCLVATVGLFERWTNVNVVFVLDNLPFVGLILLRLEGPQIEVTHYARGQYNGNACPTGDPNDLGFQLGNAM